mmetsp:Transcript_22981/g.45620  ORF Transcript_22981/g.45620 Transcript_22981/m.45620 type:complete len:446 (-) Transcript_22981:204-1541(-)
MSYVYRVVSKLSVDSTEEVVHFDTSTGSSDSFSDANRAMGDAVHSLLSSKSKESFVVSLFENGTLKRERTIGEVPGSRKGKSKVIKPKASPKVEHFMCPTFSSTPCAVKKSNKPASTKDTECLLQADVASSSKLLSKRSSPESTARLEKAPVGAEFKRAKLDADATPSKALKLSPDTDGKLLAAAKKKATTAKAKRATDGKDENWRCSGELLRWVESKTVHQELEKRTTEQLKLVCEENGLPRSGAKYKLKGLLLAHAKAAGFRHEAAGTGGVAAGIATQFAKSGLTFARALGLFAKLVKGSSKLANFRERVETVQAAAKGMDYQIYCAITGPNAKKYNGSRGEAGLEAHADVAKALADVFCACAEAGGFMDGGDDGGGGALFAEFMDWVRDPSSTKCAPFGFDEYAKAMDLAWVAQKQHPGAWEKLTSDQKAVVGALPKGGGYF